MINQLTTTIRTAWHTRYLRSLFLISFAVAILFPVIDRYFVYPQFANALILDTEKQAVRVARHLALDLEPGPDGLTADNLSEAFIEEMPQTLKTLDLWKIKIFSRNGETLHSSDVKDIGAANKHVYFHETVALGATFTKVVLKDTLSLEGQTVARDVVETYVPLMEKGTFQGAFEIYFDITDRLAALDRLLFTSQAILLVVTLALLLALIGTVLRATKAVEDRRRADAALRESELRYRTLVDVSPDAICLNSPHGLTYANRSAVRLFGVSDKEALLGRNIFDFLSGRETNAAKEAFQAVFDSGQGSQVFHECHLKALDGRKAEVEIMVLPISGEDGSRLAEVILHDLTTRLEAERYHRMTTVVFEASAEAMMATDADKIIEMINPAFTKITGYESKDVIGKDPHLLSSGYHPAEFFAEMCETLLREGFWYGDVRNRRKNGEIYVARLTISALRDPDGELSKYVALFSDATEETMEAERLENRANRDVLTGLPNRFMLSDQLGTIVSNQRRPHGSSAVLFLDLDGFKPINDTYGHAAGDIALKEVAKRLTARVRDDDVVARLGGDEFVVVLRNVSDRAKAEEIAGNVLQVFDDPFDVGVAEVNMGCSIGMALFPEHGEGSNTLIELADKAMYRAKKGGKGRICVYDPDLDEARETD